MLTIQIFMVVILPPHLLTNKPANELSPSLRLTFSHSPLQHQHQHRLLFFVFVFFYYYSFIIIYTLYIIFCIFLLLFRVCRQRECSLQSKSFVIVRRMLQTKHTRIYCICSSIPPVFTEQTMFKLQAHTAHNNI